MQRDSRMVDVGAAQLATMGEDVVPLLCSFLTNRAMMVQDYRNLEGELRNSRGVYTPKYRRMESEFMEKYHQNVDFEQMSELTSGRGLWYNPVKGALKALELIGDSTCLGVLASLPFDEAKSTISKLASFSQKV
jgi:hypothetical protein